MFIMTNKNTSVEKLSLHNKSNKLNLFKKKRMEIYYNRYIHAYICVCVCINEKDILGLFNLSIL
jgi:hypothetical protein